MLRWEARCNKLTPEFLVSSLRVLLVLSKTKGTRQLCYCNNELAAHGRVSGMGGSTQYEGKHPVGPSGHVRSRGGGQSVCGLMKRQHLFLSSCDLNLKKKKYRSISDLILDPAGLITLVTKTIKENIITETGREQISHTLNIANDFFFFSLHFSILWCLASRLLPERNVIRTWGLRMEKTYIPTGPDNIQTFQLEGIKYSSVKSVWPAQSH